MSTSTNPLFALFVVSFTLLILLPAETTSLNSFMTLTGQPTETCTPRLRPCTGCGDGVCDHPAENCLTCPTDCGACAPCVSRCGNGICDGNETGCSCPEDCGLCCVDGVCRPEKGETFRNCPSDCTVDLTVLVVDSVTFAPLPNSVVECTSSDFSFGPLTSDTGGYSFQNIAPGVYSCLGRKFSYLPNQASFVASPSFRNLTALIPVAQERGSITGLTLDILTDGPLAGTSVTCSNGTYTTPAVLSNSKGEYFFSDLYPANWVCAGQKTGYSVTFNNGTLVSGGHVQIDLIMRPVPAGVSGVVVSADTLLPVVAPTVTCFQLNFTQSTVGSASGSYIVDNVNTGSIACNASKEGYVSQIKSTTVPAGTIVTLNFQLDVLSSTLTGPVLDSVTGQGIPSVSVSCFFPAIGETVETTADENGVYTIVPISAGSWVCTASRQGWSTKISPTQILPGTVQSLPFVLDPFPANLYGTVLTTDGDAVLSASVTCVFTASPKPQADLGPFFTNSTGDFGFENIVFRTALPRLTFTCTANKTGFGVGVKTGELLRGTTVTVLIPLLPLGIRVTVLHNATGETLPGARVTCTSPTNTVSGVSGTNGDGVILFSGLTLGGYNCTATYTGYTTDYASVVINNLSGTQPVTLRIEPQTFPISGYVIARADTIVTVAPGANVTILDVTRTLTLTTVTADSTGRYIVYLPLPNNYTFFLSYTENFQRSFVFIPLTLADVGRDKNISTVATVSRIFGEIRDAGTRLPLVNAGVALYDSQGRVVRSQTTDASGVYNFPALSPGTYTVEGRSEGYITVSVPAQITRAGLSLNFTLLLSPDLFGRIVGRVVRAGLNPTGISGANVTLTAPGVSTFTITRSDGSYNFSQVVPGSVRVTANSPGFLAGSLDAAITAAQTIQVRDIALVPSPGSISGKVLRGTGECLCIARVDLQLSTGGVVGSVNIAQNSPNFSFQGLDAGSYTLRFVNPNTGGSITRAVTVTGGSNTDVGGVDIASILSGLRKK